MSVKKEKFVVYDTEASLRSLAEKFNNSSHSDCYQVLDEVLRIIKESSSFDKLQIGEFLSVIKNSVNVIKLEDPLRTDIRCRESLCILFSIYINEELIRNEKGSLETINRISSVIDTFVEDENYVIKIFRKVSQIINRLGTVMKDKHTVKLLIKKYIDKDVFKCKRTRFSEFRELLVVYNFWYSNLNEKLEKKILLNLVISFLANNPEHTNLLKSQLKWRNEDKRKTKVKSEIQAPKHKLNVDPEVITIDDDSDSDVVIVNSQSKYMKNESIIKADNVDSGICNIEPTFTSIQLNDEELSQSSDDDNQDEAFVKFVLGSSNRNFNDLNEKTDKIIANETIAILISRLQEHLSTCKKSTILRFLHDFVWILKKFSHNLKASEIRQNVSKVLSMLNESKSSNFQYNDLNVDECLSSLISLYIDVELSLYQIEKKSEETLKRISSVLDASSGNDFFLIEVLRKVTRFSSLKELIKCKKIAKAILRKYFTNEQKGSCRFLTNKEFLEYCIVYNLWYSIIDNQPEKDILLNMVSNFISPKMENIKLLKLQLKSESKGSIIHTALKTSKKILEEALNANKTIIVEEEIIIDDDDLIIISDDENDSTTMKSSFNKSKCNLVIQDFIKSENIEFSMKVEKLSLTDPTPVEVPVSKQDDSMKIINVCVHIPIAKVESVDVSVIENLELSFEMKDLSSSSRNISLCEEVSEDSTTSSEKEDVTLSILKVASETEENNILPIEYDLNTLPLKKSDNVPISPEKIICDNIPSTSKSIQLKTKEPHNDDESILNIPNTSRNSFMHKKVVKKTPKSKALTILNSKKSIKYSTVECPDSTSPSDTDHSFSSVSSQCDDEEYGSKTIKDTVKHLENLQAEIQKPKEITPPITFKSKSFINLPKPSVSNQELTKEQTNIETDGSLLSKKITSPNNYYELKMDQKIDLKLIPEYSRCQPGKSSDFLLKKNERIQAPDISSTSGDDNSSENLFINSSKQIVDVDNLRENVEILHKKQFEDLTHSEDNLLLKSLEKELIEDRSENSPVNTIPETDSIQFNTDSDTDSGFKSENDCVRKSPFNNDFELSDDASDSPKSTINIDDEIVQEETILENTIESEDKQNNCPEEAANVVVVNSNIVDPSAMYLNLEDFNSSFGSDESYFNVDENMLRDFSGHKLERNLSTDKESSSSSSSPLEQSEEKSPLKGLDGDFLLFDSPFYSPTRNDADRDRDPYLPCNFNDLFKSDNPDLKMIDPSTIWLSQNNTSTVQHKSNIEESSPLTPYTMDNEFTPSETLKDYVESLIDSLNDSYQKQTEDNEQIVNTLLDDFTTSKIFDQSKTVISDVLDKVITKESENPETVESLILEKSNVPLNNPTIVVNNKEEDIETLDTIQKSLSVTPPSELTTVNVGKLNYKISNFSLNSKKRKRSDPVKIIQVEDRSPTIFTIFPNPIINPLTMKNAFENGLNPQHNINSKRHRFCDETIDVSPDSSPFSINSPSSLSPSENSQTICSFQNFSETKMNKNKRIESSSIPIKTKSSMKSFLDKEVVFNAKKNKSNKNKTYNYSYTKKSR